MCVINRSAYGVEAMYQLSNYKILGMLYVRGRDVSAIVPLHG